MSLELNSLLWVLPGICFLFAYHRLRDVESLEFHNWSYVFFIVLIGVITILPVQYLLKEYALSLGTLLISSLVAFLLPFIIRLIFDPFVQKLDKNPNFFTSSTFWSLIYFFYPLENRDKFIKNCIDYEGTPVLITVDEPILIKHEKKNGTDSSRVTNIQSSVFLGILLEFPYVATRSIDSHAIRILPLLRGYRYIEQSKKEKEEIKWIKKYDQTEEAEGLIIPRSKIIHFCAYDKDQHDDIIFGSNYSDKSSKE